VAEEIRTLLDFGGFDPVVRENGSDLSDVKALDAMRGCGAGIILVHAQGQDAGAAPANVLLEIGAAMALYRNRLVLLLEEAAALPPDVGLVRQVRFAGESLDQQATLGLMKILAEFKRGNQ
jgi:hypothetical protein